MGEHTQGSTDDYLNTRLDVNVSTQREMFIGEQQNTYLNRVESTGVAPAESTFVAIVYPDMQRAAEVMKALKELQGKNAIDLQDAVYVTKDAKSKVKLHRANRAAGKGAAGGSIAGLIVGSVLLTPIGGAALGAATGAFVGKHTDMGIKKDFVELLAYEMKPASSAVFVLVRQSTRDQVVPVISAFGGRIIETSLPEETAAALQHYLDAGQATPPSPPSPAP